MRELTADNAAAYLRDRFGIDAAAVTALSGGVSNLVLRVETADSCFVLKQSRPQLRTRDAWFSDLDRIYREQEVMEALAGVLADLTVPRVLFADRENFVFAMSHAPPARVWKEMLLAGEIDADMGRRAGAVLGRMHETSARERERFAAFAERTVFVQLRVDPFYRRVQERRPEVAAAVQPLIDAMLTRREALCHGDYTPKNMLVHAQGFTLVDYETAHLGDPAMDLGLFLAHLFLKSVRRPDERGRFFALIESFLASYAAENRYAQAHDWSPRAAAHLGACLLARIDGTSPVDYLPEEPKRELVRRLGRAILNDGMTDVGEVLAWCDKEFNAKEPCTK
jgi:5-methylthioribose kinase